MNINTNDCKVCSNVSCNKNLMKRKEKIDILCPCMCEEHFLWECVKCGEISFDCFDLFKLKINQNTKIDYYSLYKINVCNMFITYLLKSMINNNFSQKILICNNPNKKNEIIEMIKTNFNDENMLEFSNKLFDKDAIILFIKENFKNSKLSDFSNELANYINKILNKDEIIDFIKQNYNKSELHYFASKIISISTFSKYFI